MSYVDMSYGDLLGGLITTDMEAGNYTPLTEATFLILLSLAHKPKHGYAIMKDVRAMSKDRVVLSTGTLYGAIRRLLEQAWIERLDTTLEEEKSEASQGRQRKAYVLTRLGSQILEAEIKRISGLAEVARLRTAGSRA